MRESQTRQTGLRSLLLLAAVSTLPAIGCQVDVAGQTLPSGYYLDDDVQFFPAGPEFKLSREAAAQKEYRETEAQRQGAYPGQPVQQ